MADMNVEFVSSKHDARIVQRLPLTNYILKVNIGGGRFTNGCVRYARLTNTTTGPNNYNVIYFDNGGHDYLRVDSDVSSDKITLNDVREFPSFWESVELIEVQTITIIGESIGEVFGLQP